MMDPRSSDRLLSGAVGPIRRSRGALRRAAAAVELALILPLFITIVLATVDFGRFAYMYLSVINASRAAAGFASCTPYSAGSLGNWRQAVREAVMDDLREMRLQPGFDATRLNISTPVVTTEAGTGFRRVTITVTYRFETIVNWPLLPGQFDLGQTVEMRRVR